MSEELLTYGDSSRKEDLPSKGKKSKISTKDLPKVVRQAKPKK